MEMDAKAIGARLRALRGNKSAYEVAEAVGISPSAVFMYEQGERIPRDTVKIKLAQYFGSSVAFLFFNESAHQE